LLHPFAVPEAVGPGTVVFTLHASDGLEPAFPQGVVEVTHRTARSVRKFVQLEPDKVIDKDAELDSLGQKQDRTYLHFGVE
jgi:hypothetical protein